ncbi:hypothetical protein N42_2125 [Lactococcus lactis subsp. lactis]|jgi:hypothetical protein|uniref:Uncharacterized protein n=1 Tax=Lactococcus lactis subsp. lactis TaxID=1360 RepID=A0A0V8EIN0_LACLL|nr:hypothetical protein N42_2125 [Lactococcus lactis subsp. lactis]
MFLLKKRKLSMNQQNKIFETKISGAWGATSKLTLKFKLA